RPPPEVPISSSAFLAAAISSLVIGGGGLASSQARKITPSSSMNPPTQSARLIPAAFSMSAGFAMMPGMITRTPKITNRTPMNVRRSNIFAKRQLRASSGSRSYFLAATRPPSVHELDVGVRDDAQEQGQRAERDRALDERGDAVCLLRGCRRGKGFASVDQALELLVGLRLAEPGRDHHRHQPDEERDDGRPLVLAEVTAERNHTDLVKDEDPERGDRADEYPPEAGARTRLLPEHADDERQEDRHVEEREERLDVVVDVAVARGEERGADADENPGDGGVAADPQVVVVRTAGPDVVLPDVVGPHRVERRDVGRHARHERG